MIQAVIFDMDGVLIDSEPLWHQAEKIVFGRVGIEITPEMSQEIRGMPTNEVVAFRYARQPWNGKTLKQVETEILEVMEDLIWAKGYSMEGMRYILDFFRKHKIRLALATSSPTRIIAAVLGKLELENTFEVVHSAEFEEKGKPDPAIYKTTLRKLELEAAYALAFEDSYNGLLSAKGAGLKTVIIPEENQWHEHKFELADLKLKSLREFREKHLRELS